MQKRRTFPNSRVEQKIGQAFTPADIRNTVHLEPGTKVAVSSKVKVTSGGSKLVKDFVGVVEQETDYYFVCNVHTEYGSGDFKRCINKVDVLIGDTAISVIK